MKRIIFAATLALIPSLLHAQANVPAQTGAQPVLQARVAPLAVLKAAAPKDAVGADLRVSTGVVAPTLVKPLILSTSSSSIRRLLANDITVVVSMTVDETGKPGNLAIAQSGGADLDRDILSAMRDTRFRPGTLDGQPCALPLRLNVTVKHEVKY